MQLTIGNIFRYLMSLTPLFIISFLLMVSVLNQNVKGLVYLGGILIVTVITIGLKRAFQLSPPEGIDANCMMFEWPEFINQYSAPDFSSMFLSFTMMYLTLPMAYKAAPLNIFLIILMLFFTVGNAATRLYYKCNNIIDIVIGNLVGAGLGVGYFFAFWASNNKKLLFIDDIASNNVSCKSPSKQTFKCAVYKNGQLVKNL